MAPTSASAGPAIFRPEIEMDGTRPRVLVDQLGAVDRELRLGDMAGRLDPEKLDEMDRAVRIVLGLL